MQKRQILFTIFLILISFSINAQTNYGAEIVSYQKFGEGLMVVKAKIVPMSGTVSNMFFFNREDEPWNNNVWYEYDWEIRGKYPNNGWSQIRVREEEGGQLKDAPVNVSTSDNLGDTFYHYILIRRNDEYIYDIRKDFNISSYNFNNSSAHNGNSVSLIIGGPRTYSTGGNVSDIPENKKLDFSIGITAFDNGWTGSLPTGSYSGDMVVDYARFYGLNSNNSVNTSVQWQDEFNNNNLDYGKWQAASWFSGNTQFTQNNIRFEDGKMILRINRDDNSGGNTSSVNLALSGQASQSSTAYSGSASRAIDNNTNGQYGNRSVTHTNNGTNSWWEVELAEDSELNQIVIYNRTDNCCKTRLSNFSVSVLDENDAVVWTQFYANPPNSSLTINLDAKGKKVRVNLDGTLSLAEVKVFGTYLSGNLALSGQASQSTTSHSGIASRAIDNNTNGKWSNGSVTHTNNQNNAWWQVDLYQNSDIDQIEIHNRTDNCCVSRLSDFTVSVLNENGSTVWSKFYDDPPTSSLIINLNATGKKVRVSLNGTLSLAEVKVFGTPSGNGSRLDLSTNAKSDLKVFPNPTTERLFVDLSQYMESDVQMILYDLSGKKQLVEKLGKGHGQIVELDITGLTNGFYLLQVVDSNYRISTEKISINRN